MGWGPAGTPQNSHHCGPVPNFACDEDRCTAMAIAVMLPKLIIMMTAAGFHRVPSRQYYCPKVVWHGRLWAVLLGMAMLTVSSCTTPVCQAVLLQCKLPRAQRRMVSGCRKPTMRGWTLSVEEE